MIKIKFVFTVDQKSYVDSCPKARVDEKSAHAESSHGSRESISDKAVAFLTKIGLMYAIRKLIDFLSDS